MFNFENLNEETRPSMLQAIEEADSRGEIYYSTRFNQGGMDQWLPLLKEAAANSNEHWLAYQLEAQSLMKDFEGSGTRFGGYTVKHVPHTAAETMAEGQFNRFYILGLCRLARTKGISHLTVYRAKDRSSPRPESEALIGTQLSIDEIEDQLKETKKSFRSPLVKPNSGLSVKFS